MNDFIDSYCERLGPGLWAEPLNAITNIAFFIAAYFAYSLARKRGGPDWRSGLLIGLIAVIGVGSTLFHTLATYWAMLSDMLPILFYQIAFITLYSSVVIGLGRLKIVGLLAGFFALSWAFSNIPYDFLNGSLAYASAFLFLLGLGIWHYFNAASEKFVLLGAAGVFALSLTFRSIDMALCDDLPIGTHFLWHCLNGCVLYLTARGFIIFRQYK